MRSVRLLAHKVIVKIGWIIPTVGIFGAVREMVEVSNILVELGHDVTIYHPMRESCIWLECLAKYGTFHDLSTEKLDVVIGVIDWKLSLYELLKSCKAQIKAFCFMGFTPSEEMAAVLRGEVDTESDDLRIIRSCIEDGMVILADSSWQLEWVRNNVTQENIGVPFGGINLNMFQYDSSRKDKDAPLLIYSGDVRKRKGTDIVVSALDVLVKSKPIQTDHYWGKRYTQAELVEFLQKGHIFLDGHRRAGWCNPVIEAMACGTVPVCTDIGAVRDFALDQETALVVPVDDVDAMAEATYRLLSDENLYKKLQKNGLEKVKQFSYDKVVSNLDFFLMGRLYG